MPIATGGEEFLPGPTGQTATPRGTGGISGHPPLGSTTWESQTWLYASHPPGGAGPSLSGILSPLQTELRIDRAWLGKSIPSELPRHRPCLVQGYHPSFYWTVLLFLLLQCAPQWFPLASIYSQIPTFEECTGSNLGSVTEKGNSSVSSVSFFPFYILGGVKR